MNIIQNEYERYDPEIHEISIRYDCYSDNEYINTITFLHHDRCYRTDSSTTRVDIQMIEVGLRNDDAGELVDLIIENKNKKIEEYLRICDECWLVIYSNPFYEEGIFNFSSIKEKLNTSKFNEVIVFDVLKPSECIILRKT